MRHLVEFKLLQKIIKIGLITERHNDRTLIICEVPVFIDNWWSLDKIKKNNGSRYYYTPGVKIPSSFQVDKFVLYKNALIEHEYIIYWIEEVNTKTILSEFQNISGIEYIFKSKETLPEYFQNAKLYFMFNLNKFIANNLKIINLDEYLAYIQETIEMGRILNCEYHSSRYSDFGYDSWNIICSSYNFKHKEIKRPEDIKWYEVKTVVDEYLNFTVPKRKYYILNEAVRDNPQVQNFDDEDIIFFKLHGERIQDYLGDNYYFKEKCIGPKSDILIEHWTKRDGQYNTETHRAFIIKNLNQLITDLWPNIFRENLSHSLRIKMPNGCFFDLIIKL